MAILCSKCGRNEATIHVCQIVEGETTTMDFCADCAPQYPSLGDTTLHLKMYAGGKQEKEIVVERIRRDYPALSPAQLETYQFISACLWVANRKAEAASGQPSIHVAAGEILAVAPAVARERLGAEARARLRAMGLTSSAAFGEAVFALIGQGILGKTPEDRIEDFRVRSAFDEFMQAP